MPIFAGIVSIAAFIALVSGQDMDEEILAITCICMGVMIVITYAAMKGSERKRVKLLMDRYETIRVLVGRELQIPKVEMGSDLVSVFLTVGGCLGEETIDRINGISGVTACSKTVLDGFYFTIIEISSKGGLHSRNYCNTRLFKKYFSRGIAIKSFTWSSIN